MFLIGDKFCKMNNRSYRRDLDHRQIVDRRQVISKHKDFDHRMDIPRRQDLDHRPQRMEADVNYNFYFRFYSVAYGRFFILTYAHKLLKQ